MRNHLSAYLESGNLNSTQARKLRETIQLVSDDLYVDEGSSQERRDQVASEIGSREELEEIFGAALARNIFVEIRRPGETEDDAQSQKAPGFQCECSIVSDWCTGGTSPGTECMESSACDSTDHFGCGTALLYGCNGDCTLGGS